MPVKNYGVVIGTFDHFDRDDKNNYGNYFHGHVFVRSSGKLYNCAVDVKYPNGSVEYFIETGLKRTLFQKISSLSEGFHPLRSDARSGALDFLRNPLLTTVGSSKKRRWKQNASMSALTDLEAFLRAPIDKLYVFGAYFKNARQAPPEGLHDVHMNQGDPPGDFQKLDGIWQDGGILVNRPGGRLETFLVKFLTQSFKTNDKGLPA